MPYTLPLPSIIASGARSFEVGVVFELFSGPEQHKL